MHHSNIAISICTMWPQVNAKVFLKATKVDGVYDSDPVKNPHAKKYAQLSYR